MTRTYIVERVWNNQGGSLTIECAKCGEQLIHQADTAPWTAADLESRICECQLAASRKQDREPKP